MAKRAPRLQFTEEERASPELAPAIQKADKKITKLEKAEAKIPKKELAQYLMHIKKGGSPFCSTQKEDMENAPEEN